MRLFNIVSLVTLSTMAACAFTPVMAQGSSCAPRDSVVKHLAEKYGESRQNIGLSRSGVMETFASDETGSWTITVTTPNGMTCLVASGQQFETLNEEVVNEGDPT